MEFRVRTRRAEICYKLGTKKPVGTARLAPPLPRIERVIQAVAEEDEGELDDGDGQRGHKH